MQSSPFLKSVPGRLFLTNAALAAVAWIADGLREDCVEYRDAAPRSEYPLCRTVRAGGERTPPQADISR